MILSGIGVTWSVFQGLKVIKGIAMNWAHAINNKAFNYGSEWRIIYVNKVIWVILHLLLAWFSQFKISRNLILLLTKSNNIYINFSPSINFLSFNFSLICLNSVSISQSSKIVENSSIVNYLFSNFGSIMHTS